MSPRPDSDRTTCARVSRRVDEDPIATAEHHDRYLLLELPMPWPLELWPSSRVPAGYRATWERAIARGIGVRPIAIAPDPAYSRDDLVRLIHFRRPRAPFAEYERDEFLVPVEAIVPLTEALLDEGTSSSTRPSRAPLGPFERYRAPSAGVRDLLVCTHGSLDACCGTYGFPFYRELRDHFDREPGVRVWRASHFGGHRFAPTVVDLPVAHYWAHLAVDDLDLFERRSGPDPKVRRRYRGWGGLPSAAAQVVESELLFRLGWASSTYRKSVVVIRGGTSSGSADLRIDLWAADVRMQAYEATVEVTGTRRVSLGCSEDEVDVAQYRVVRFEKLRVLAPI